MPNLRVGPVSSGVGPGALTCRHRPKLQLWPELVVSADFERLLPSHEDPIGALAAVPQDLDGAETSLFPLLGSLVELEEPRAQLASQNIYHWSEIFSWHRGLRYSS